MSISEPQNRTNPKPNQKTLNQTLTKSRNQLTIIFEAVKRPKDQKNIFFYLLK